MKEFEIWLEGYFSTGESSSACFLGKSMGETFDEACINFRQEGIPIELDKKPDGTYRRGSYRGDKIQGEEKENKVGNYSIWACQLFDNETDARKLFG